MSGIEVTVGQAAVICAFSMGVIFAVLLSISLLIDLLAVWMKRRSRADAPAEISAPVAAVPVQASEEAVPREIETELILITAAVASYLGKRTDEIVVREIRKVQNVESEWSRSVRTEALRDK